MEEKIEIMNLLQSKQTIEHELQSLVYGSVEIRENDSNKYIYVSRSFFITNPFDVYAQSYIALSILSFTVGFSSCGFCLFGVGLK